LYLPFYPHVSIRKEKLVNLVPPMTSYGSILQIDVCRPADVTLREACELGTLPLDYFLFSLHIWFLYPSKKSLYVA
jgi:hypothetical protein